MLNAKNIQQIEKQIFMIEDLSKNITPEYWPHQIFIDDDNYSWVKPEYFYPHFRCLMAIADPHLSNEGYALLEDIESELFRFFVWLNNNPIIAEDYIPHVKQINSLKQHLELQCMQKITSIAQIIYVQTAPQIYYILNSAEGETQSFFNYFEDVKSTLSQIISTLPSENEKTVVDFSSNIFEILANQGVK